MDLLLERGRNAMAQGHPEIAIQHLTALIDHAPDFAEAWNARATAYYQTGNLGPSVADIGHVLTLNPRHFGALAGLGAIFEELEQTERGAGGLQGRSGDQSPCRRCRGGNCPN